MGVCGSQGPTPDLTPLLPTNYAAPELSNHHLNVQVYALQDVLSTISVIHSLRFSLLQLATTVTHYQLYLYIHKYYDHLEELNQV